MSALIPALIVEKDFGAGSYKTIINEYRGGASALNVENVIHNLNCHFNCEVMDSHYTKEELETYKGDIEKLIKKQIDSGRPIMLYFQSGYSGHAAVIDGYSYIGDKFIVHINQGASGYGNKWYDFNEPRILLTIKPPIDNTKRVTKTLHKTNYLLETQWDKEGNYSKFCPKNETLGHWSTALAQILAYHKYQPTGKINYKTSPGLKINENLDSYKFNWGLFMERLDAKASKESIDQVAKYNYYTEVILERDFGSMEYNTIIEDESNIDVSKAINNLNRYFNCNANAYKYIEEEIKLSRDTIFALIKTEIDNKCPLLLYYKPYSEDGYCVVIDGYSEENNRFFIHINTGMDGCNNHWYELFGPLADTNNSLQ
ncbi:MAG: C10 family peptidase [Tepidanaerobacteraceae bacterium]